MPKVTPYLLWICFATLYDWFKNNSHHLFNQSDAKPKRNRHLVTRVFPRLAPVTCICFQFSLAHVVVLWLAIAFCCRLDFTTFSWIALKSTHYVHLLFQWCFGVYWCHGAWSGHPRSGLGHSVWPSKQCKVWPVSRIVRTFLVDNDAATLHAAMLSLDVATRCNISRNTGNATSNSWFLQVVAKNGVGSLSRIRGK